MKTIALLLTLATFGTAGYLSYRHFSGARHEEQAIYYTCPMHPHIHEDKPGECPICHMKLVPVPSPPSPLPPGGEGGITIPPERQQLIGLKTAIVEKREFVKTIRSPARVAFDPDLAVAQAEYLEIARSVPSLYEASHQRLKLLGMSEMEIEELERRGEPDPALLLPNPGGIVWVYAPLYGPEWREVIVGTNVTVRNESEIFEGTVRGVEPVADPITRSVRARIELSGAGGKILSESFLEALFKLPLGEKIVVPKSAVLETGSRAVVFVIQDGVRFTTRDVGLGSENEGERVILEGLKEGEIVAASAAFLIDSESRLKAAVSGMGGHQH